LPYFSVIKLIGPDFHLGYAHQHRLEVFLKKLSRGVDGKSGYRTRMEFWRRPRDHGDLTHSCPRPDAEKPMCDKCAELDGRIEHYRRIAAAISDQLTISRIKELVAKLETQKAELHPEQQK